MRPQVSVYSLKGEATEGNVKMPAVFKAPIRTDIVTFVHSEMRKNSRQPYAVSKKAGKTPNIVHILQHAVNSGFCTEK